MKKFLIIAVALAILAPVAAAHAFSFVDVINFGKRLIQREVQPPPTEVKKESAVMPIQFPALSAEKKFDNWQNAFNKKNISLVLADNRNLYFTDAEINYLIARELASSTVAQNVTVSFSDNLIKISGDVAIKNLSGPFYLEAKPTVVKNRVSFQVTMARYHNFYFPSFIAQLLLAGQLRDAIDFLYSDADYQNLSMTVGSGFIELNYVIQ
ncbi:MAG: hypothetical protein PHO56_01455 [Patescibacteria group bacterium]|nr:hypothetical protein [Patescibacteria group bacterium]